MDHITYDYYRIFYYVAKYRSLSVAAEVLHSNQPNLSKFMNKLEAQLGCRLMIRSNKGISLTPEGEKLFGHVAVAYQELREAEDELIEAGQLTAGTIRIGATETALHGVLLQSLAKFRKQFPKVRLLITNGSTPRAISALGKGLIDFAVVTSPFVTPANFRETPLASFRELLVAAADTAFSDIACIAPQEIAAYPVIGLGGHSKTFEFYSGMFLPYGVEWKPDIDVATADQILPMIKAGLGIGFLPEFMARQELRQGGIREIPIPPLRPERKLILLEDKTQNLNIAANALKRMLLSERSAQSFVDHS